ncbi:MAG TPA: hypothetical protein DEG96_09945 [Candidatus Atribacteria bacterium]|uniref:Amine oxidase n=1 Tax=candidate division TA06 bacterium 34_109 TaxID=1635277 RepID=A0A101I0V9_UNCT6|nr:MAG: Amine oxidase [candidate division TA06 bacterium 34_109]HBY58155.1 hypothetical protein [Candidatus Atribacteria bacterium]
MGKPQISILGAGLSGLSAAYHLREKGYKTVLYEKEAQPGGLCRSENIDGFIFDHGIHISFTKDEYIRNLFAQSVNDQFEEHRALSLNYFQGHWIKHPAQNNLYGLPISIVKDCLVDFIKAKYEYNFPVRNYRDWCHLAFGKAFCAYFTHKYTRKFWSVEPEELTTDWVGERLYKPNIEEVIEGALKGEAVNRYYINSFRYPVSGGFQSFLKVFLQGQNLKLGYNLKELDLKNKVMAFKNGTKEHYEILISTIPLPELIGIMKDVPEEVKQTTGKLKWTSLFMINIAVCRKLTGQHYWNYYYDEQIPFSRVFFMSRFAKNNAPLGYETLQIEIPYSQAKPLKMSREDIIEVVLNKLRGTGDLLPGDNVRILSTMNIDYGYVIFDFERERNLAIIHQYLRDNGVFYCGRFGEWDYLWTDQTVLSGKRVASELSNMFQEGKKDE